MGKRLYICATALVLSACANSFETRPDTGQAVFEGVRYYEPGLFEVTYVFTVLTDKDGGIIGAADTKSCEPGVQKVDLAVLPDFSKPRLLINKPSSFSSGKLGVTLDRGMLTAVNVENTPVTGTALTVLGTLGAAAITATFAAEDLGDKSKKKRQCNSSPVIGKIVKARGF